MNQPIIIGLIVTVAFLASYAQNATYVQGRDIFIETGVDQPDRVPTWYASMVAKQEFNKQGITVVLVTHRPIEEFRPFSTQIIRLLSGKSEVIK